MKIRLKYTKVGDISYISHLDVVKLMERIFRRAKVNIAYSEGFNPHPKMSFGPALGLGVESICEYIDIELKEEIRIERILEQLNAVSVSGLEFIEAVTLPEKSGSIVAYLTHSDYEVSIDLEDACDASTIFQRALAINQAEEVLLTRKTKKGNPVSYDMKEYIGRIVCEETENGLRLLFRVCSGSVKSINPKVVLDQLLQSMDPNDYFVRIRKIDTLHIEEESGEVCDE